MAVASSVAMAGCGSTARSTSRAASKQEGSVRPASITSRWFDNPHFSISFRYPSTAQVLNGPGGRAVSHRAYAATVSLFVSGTGTLTVYELARATREPMLPIDLQRVRENLEGDVYRDTGHSLHGVRARVVNGFQTVLFTFGTYPDGHAFGPGAVVVDGTTAYTFLVRSQPAGAARSFMKAMLNEAVGSVRARVGG
jgi:hypothetical protein